MSLDELLEIIQKSKFQNLLDKQDFKLVYKKHEAKGGRQDSYLIGFESENCKLGFHYEANISVAVINKSSDWETAEWIGLEYVISYLLKRPIHKPKQELKHSRKHLSYKEELINKLSLLAEDAEQLFDELVQMFQDSARIAQWKTGLEEYIKDDTRRRYGLN